MVHTSFQVSKALTCRLITLFLLATLFANFLVACGSSASLPATYTAADSTHLAVISWQQNGQDLSGTWITWSADTPAPLQAAISGQVQDNRMVTLTTEGSALQGNYDGNHLTLHGTTNEGQFQSSIWSPLSQEQANQLSSAFMKYIVLRTALDQLQQTLIHTPTDSDPYTYAGIVQSAQAYITTLQQWHDQIMALGNPCGSGLLGLFRAQYPPNSSTFTLSNVQLAQNSAGQNAQLVVKDSTENTQLSAVQSAWQIAHAAPLPPIQVSLVWQISQSDEEKTVQQGHSQVDTLMQLLTDDFTSMASLQSKAQQLGADVQSLATSNGC